MNLAKDKIHGLNDALAKIREENVTKDLEVERLHSQMEEFKKQTKGQIEERYVDGRQMRKLGRFVFVRLAFVLFCFYVGFFCCWFLFLF